MDILRAKELLTILADGVNPMTGEVLPQEDSCNQVEVVRALHTILGAVPEEKQKQQQPENVGKLWTETEEAALIKAFDAGEPIAQIAKAHGRTRGAIRSRLTRLGK